VKDDKAQKRLRDGENITVRREKGKGKYPIKEKKRARLRQWVQKDVEHWIHKKRELLELTRLTWWGKLGAVTFEEKATLNNTRSY